MNSPPKGDAQGGPCEVTTFGRVGTLGLAITAAVRGLLNGVGGRLDVVDEHTESVSSVWFEATPKNVKHHATVHIERESSTNRRYP